MSFSLKGNLQNSTMFKKSKSNCSSGVKSTYAKLLCIMYNPTYFTKLLLKLKKKKR